MWFVKDTLLLFLIVVAAYFVALTQVPVDFYLILTQQQFDSGGLFFWYAAVAEFLLGFVIAFTFLVPLLFSGLDRPKKNWWIGFLLFLVAWFVVQADLLHTWFYIFIALIGWGIGIFLNKLIHKNKTVRSG